MENLIPVKPVLEHFLKLRVVLQHVFIDPEVALQEHLQLLEDEDSAGAAVRLRRRVDLLLGHRCFLDVPLACLLLQMYWVDGLVQRNLEVFLDIQLEEKTELVSSFERLELAERVEQEDVRVGLNTLLFPLFLILL